MKCCLTNETIVLMNFPIEFLINKVNPPRESEKGGGGSTT